MTITEINEVNEKFQKSAVQLSELIPSGSLVRATSILIRNVRKVNDQLLKLLATSSEEKAEQILNALDKETDEMLFILDQLEIANKARKISIINNFLKEGYDVITLYTKAFDYVVSQKIKK